MARLTQIGFELNSVTAGVEFDTVTGSPTVQTTTVRSGTYAFQANPSSATAFLTHRHQTIGTINRTFHRFYVYINSLPAADAAIFQITDEVPTVYVQIKLTTTGFLQLFGTSTQIGSSSGGLMLKTWYRVEVDYDDTAANNTTSAYVAIGDAQATRFASGNGSDANGRSDFRVGVITSTTANLIFDDIAVNDTTGSNQNGLCGPGKIIHLKPSAAGDSNGFTVQVGGTAGGANNFTRVQENTPDDATTYNGAALLNAEDLFNCDNFTGGAFIFINVVAVGIRFADLVAGDATTGVKLEIEKTTSGTKSLSANLIPNSTSFLTNTAAQPRNYSLVTYADPDGGLWGQSTLDSMQIGYINDTVGVQTVAVSTVWASVDFTPVLPGGTTTSTSSTSSTSSSISSTSSSTSSTSTSVSTTSFSTSSTSSSTSTSSTSSSTSSTSSSISSTSTSSTSASTSVSSTSSSISSTSTSSTSTSSTSSSTSISSTSSSFSSTSSSVSSTSQSTSSTSFSSTSSSSSTSTTLPMSSLEYTYEDKLTLPSSGADLLNPFTNPQYSNVSTDDGDYFIEYGSEYMIREYERHNTNNTDNIKFTWKGRTTKDTRISPMLIQIFNSNSSTWETLAVANTVPADVDFQVTVTQTTNLSNYYATDFGVIFRSYQQVI